MHFGIAFYYFSYEFANFLRTSNHILVYKCKPAVWWRFLCLMSGVL